MRKTAKEFLRQTLKLRGSVPIPQDLVSERQDILGKPIISDGAKRHKTFGMLELWGATPLRGSLLLWKGAKKVDRRPNRDEEPPADTREPAKKSEWRTIYNKKADRRDDQISGNERVPWESGGHRCIH
jgi:hypothetical protein